MQWNSRFWIKVKLSTVLPSLSFLKITTWTCTFMKSNTKLTSRDCCRDKRENPGQMVKWLSRDNGGKIRMRIMKRPFLINKRIRPPFLILWAITSSNDCSLINNWCVCGGVVTSWLVCLPAHGIRALDEDIAMVLGHYPAITVALFTQVCKWVLANLMLGEGEGVGVTPRWTGIPSSGK